MDIFVKQQKVILPERKDGEENADLVCSLNRNLSSYGYTLDQSAIEHLSNCSRADIAEFYKELTSGIKDYFGTESFLSAEPFYPNFPEEVMEKSEAELYMNSMLYYFAQYNFSAGEYVRDLVTDKEKTERYPFFEDFSRPLKVINETTIKDISKEMSAKVHGTGLSVQDFRDIMDFIEKHPDTKEDVLALDEKFASNESKVKLAEYLYADYKKKPDRENFFTISRLLNKTNDILRLYAVLGARKKGITDITDYANLSFDRMNRNFYLTHRKNVNFPYALKGVDKQLIKSLLAKSDDLYTGVWTHEDIWQKAFTQYLSISENSNSDLQKVKDNLYHKNRVDRYGKEFLTQNRKLEIAVDNFLHGELKTLPIVARMSPGLFAKNFDATLQKIIYSDKSDQEKVFLARELSKIYAGLDIPIGETLKLRRLIDEGPDWEIKTVTTKTGKLIAYENTNTADRQLSALDGGSETRDLIMDAVSDGFTRSLERNVTTQDYGSVYIDPELVFRKVPGRNVRSASDDTVLTRNSVIPGNENKNLLIAGIAWTGKGIDMDLSVSAYDEDYQFKTCVSYFGIATKWGVHSGDYISAPNGAEELILIDKQKLKESGVRYLTMVVNGYSGSFDTAKDPVRFCMMEREGGMDGLNSFKDFHKNKNEDGSVMFMGEVIEPATFEFTASINGSERMATPVMYDVERDEFTWIDEKRNIGRGLANVVNNDAISTTKAILYRAEHNATPDMHELISAVTYGNTYTEDMEKADTLFLANPVDPSELKEGAVVHTASDLGFFSELSMMKHEKDRTKERTTKDQEQQKEH